MATLVRQMQVRWVKDGKRVPANTPGAKKTTRRARKWYGQGIPGLPPTKRVPLAADKNVARQMLAELVKKAERGEAGIDDKPTEARRVALEEHIADFQVALEVKGTGPKQVAQQIQRIRDTFNGCAFVYPQDLDADKLAKYLADRRCKPRRDGGISIQTSNFYLQAVRQFCKWMVKKRRLASDPMIDTAPMNAKLDRRHDRRNLEPGELTKLFDTVKASERIHRHLTGMDRFWLYHVVCSSGFRKEEMAILTPESFDLVASPPTVSVAAGYTKNGKTVRQPIPRTIVEGLAGYLKGKPAGEPVWPGTWSEKAAKMLRKDLADAGIPYVVQGIDGPLFADFHALRHTYITMLERAGVSLKEAQVLARHSDPKLTIGRYTHADHAQLGKAVDRLGGAAAEAPLTPEQIAGAIALGWTVLGFLLGVVTPGLHAPDVTTGESGATDGTAPPAQGHSGGAPRDGVVTRRVTRDSETGGNNRGQEGTEKGSKPTKGKRRKS